MADSVKLAFSAFATPQKGVLLVFCDDKQRFGTKTKAALGRATDLVKRAAAADGFTGKRGRVLNIIAPEGLKVARLLVVGTGDEKAAATFDFIKLGAQAMGHIPAAASEAVVLAELASGPLSAKQAADLALGIRLRAYAFERYKTKRKEDEEPKVAKIITIGVDDPTATRRAFEPVKAAADGVDLARDLVNEPANVLYPEEFARRAEELKSVGVDLEVFDVKAMTRLGMRALLGVGQGSAHDSRFAVMRWNGGKRGEAPVAFIGKGVCFDTGGISIKPASGMEDMKGDMAGAACVVGLMHTLAARKAKVNAVGAIGIVENMPGGNAQRPGDIVKSLSGQTIEIINTDAEGRLVLADVLWYVADRFKPKFMIDLATLTGAIIVALGHEHAGLFANDDELAERLKRAGEETGEKVWRMPLAPEYDKLMDSKVADVKNTGGRWAGAITAAQFLQRFVPKGVAWAHLDIAGTGMGPPPNDVNRSWGSGYGVRLLNQLVADNYER